jgi:hypothetical protein
VDRAVELAVATAVQSVSAGVAGAGGDWCRSGVPGERGFAAEALSAGGVADQDRGGDRSAAALGEQLRGVLLDEGGQFGLEL